MPPVRRGQRTGATNTRSGGRAKPVIPARDPAPVPVPVEEGVIEVPRGEANKGGGALQAIKPQNDIDQVFTN